MVIQTVNKWCTEMTLSLTLIYHTLKNKQKYHYNHWNCTHCEMNPLLTLYIHLCFVYYDERIHGFQSSKVKPPRSHGLFYRCPFIFLHLGTLQLCFCLWEGQRTFSFHQKYPNLCSEDEGRSYGFGTTQGWEISDRTSILGWTNPLSTKQYFSTT